MRGEIEGGGRVIDSHIDGVNDVFGLPVFKILECPAFDLFKHQSFQPSCGQPSAVRAMILDNPDGPLLRDIEPRGGNLSGYIGKDLVKVEDGPCTHLAFEGIDEREIALCNIRSSFHNFVAGELI